MFLKNNKKQNWNNIQFCESLQTKKSRLSKKRLFSNCSNILAGPYSSVAFSGSLLQKNLWSPLTFAHTMVLVLQRTFRERQLHNSSTGKIVHTWLSYMCYTTRKHSVVQLATKTMLGTFTSDLPHSAILAVPALYYELWRATLTEFCNAYPTTFRQIRHLTNSVNFCNLVYREIAYGRGVEHSDQMRPAWPSIVARIRIIRYLSWNTTLHQNETPRQADI